MENLVKVLSDIKNTGRNVILVSSGAIGVGVGKMGLKERPKDTPTKQAIAAVGQCELMYIYDKLFSVYHHTVAQVLLTGDVLEHPQRCANVLNTFNRLADLGCIPIVNENDTVAVEEIEFGDNDALSALVAKLTNADALIMLTDTDGLFTKNPNLHSDATLIEDVCQIDAPILAAAESTCNSLGTGGMSTKLRAAQTATENGIDAFIINGKNPLILYDLFDGKKCSTFFHKKEKL
jgi:glutamate 5-kinase